MRNFWGTLFMNDISDRVLNILSTNLPIYLEGKPFLNSMSDWFDKILEKAVLYKKSKQEDKYHKLLESLQTIATTLNEKINEDSILREYSTYVQFNIFEVQQNEQEPLVLKIYFNVMTKASYNPKAFGMNLFTYISDKTLTD